MNRSERNKLFTRDLLYELHHVQKLTTAEISKKYNLSLKSLYASFQNYKVPIIQNHNKVELPKEILEKLIFEDKMSRIQLCKYFNVSESLLRDRLNELGFKVPRQNKRPEEINIISDQELVNLYTIQKLNLSQISRESGIARETVRAKLIRAGVDTSQKTDFGHINWTGFGEISGSYFANIRATAEKRGIRFEVTIEYLWELFIQQERRCKLCGVELFFPLKKTDEANASLDRIDCSVWYREGNLRWVDKLWNTRRFGKSDEYFIERIHEFSDYQRSLELKNKIE